MIFAVIVHKFFNASVILDPLVHDRAGLSEMRLTVIDFLIQKFRNSGSRLFGETSRISQQVFVIQSKVVRIIREV